MVVDTVKDIHRIRVTASATVVAARLRLAGHSTAPALPELIVTTVANANTSLEAYL